jgi:hypothetical protein
MIYSQAIAPQGQLLAEREGIETLHKGFDGQFARQKVLVLIPDHTRSLPLPFLFRALVGILRDTRQLDFMVALGTHHPLSEDSMNELVGITAEERTTVYKHIGLLNHVWDDPSELDMLGVIEQEQIKAIAGERWHPTGAFVNMMKRLALSCCQGSSCS